MLLSILLCVTLVIAPRLGGRIRNKRCVDSMQLPCSVNGTNYTMFSKNKCGTGSYGCVVQALNNQNNKVYAIKFSQTEVHEQNNHFLDEINTTLTVWDYFDSLPDYQQFRVPSITLFDWDKLVINISERTFINVILVMEYHHLGDAENICRSPIYALPLRKRRDEFVLKLLHDVGTVLHSLYLKNIIDRDCKLKNILIAGNPKHPTATTFVKCDYGTAISVKGAVKELTRTDTIPNNFCHFGSNVSPIDARIMYGKHKGKDCVVERHDAAKILMNNLESNDLVDLVQAAISFYDRLTVNDSERIGLYQNLIAHDEESRRWVINEKLRVLLIKYNKQMLQDPKIPPTTVKELLIKFEWLSVKQLPGLDSVNTRKYLRWHTLCKWILSVARHQKYWMYQERIVEQHNESRLHSIVSNISAAVIANSLTYESSVPAS